MPTIDFNQNVTCTKSSQADPKLAKYFGSDAYKLPVNNAIATPYFL